MIQYLQIYAIALDLLARPGADPSITYKEKTPLESLRQLKSQVMTRIALPPGFGNGRLLRLKWSNRMTKIFESHHLHGKWPDFEPIIREYGMCLQILRQVDENGRIVLDGESNESRSIDLPDITTHIPVGPSSLRVEEMGGNVPKMCGGLLKHQQARTKGGVKGTDASADVPSDLGSDNDSAAVASNSNSRDLVGDVESEGQALNSDQLSMQIRDEYDSDVFFDVEARLSDGERLTAVAVSVE